MPESTNPRLNLNAIRRARRQQPTVDEFVAGIRAGNRILLSQAITLIESTKNAHQAKARQIVEACLPHAGNSVRIGITGTPGVGKSTFIEALGIQVIEQGHKLAVLAVDPSSQVTKGSILGDKTRMQKLSVREEAFIRPSAAGSSLGGVARRTRESIILCEAAGYDTIFVETVGVGQSETAVHSMTDFFLLLLLPNAGDELQGIKRGVMEMADLIAVNKADGNLAQKAKLARRAYKNALHLFPPKASGWVATAETCSALQKEGLDTIWSLIEKYVLFTQEKGFFTQNRASQARFWLYESVEDALKRDFYQNPQVQALQNEIETAVTSGQISSFQAAQKLLHTWRKNRISNND